MGKTKAVCRKLEDTKAVYNNLCLALFGLVLAMTPTQAHAFTAPSSGDIGYEIYNFFSEVVLTGAIGIIIILAIICYAVYWILRSNVFGAVACFVAAAIFYSAEDIATAMGLMF